jgi:hypothetical protein
MQCSGKRPLAVLNAICILAQLAFARCRFFKPPIGAAAVRHATDHTHRIITPMHMCNRSADDGVG